MQIENQQITHHSETSRIAFGEHHVRLSVWIRRIGKYIDRQDKIIFIKVVSCFSWLKILNFNFIWLLKMGRKPDGIAEL